MTSDWNFDKSNLPSVKIVKTIPDVGAEKLFSYRECYMGISLDNAVFGGDSLAALLLWATGKFDTCLVVVGDYLRRHNEYILNGMDDFQAQWAALGAGDEFIERTKGLFDKLPKGKVRIIRWRDCLGFEEYPPAKAALDKLFAGNDDFKAAVHKDAISFVDRQANRDHKLAVSQEEAIAVSCEYLLEEIAVFSALSSRGRHVELYPGCELEVLVEISGGKFTDIPQGLRERINVELSCGANKAWGQ